MRDGFSESAAWCVGQSSRRPFARLACLALGFGIILLAGCAPSGYILRPVRPEAEVGIASYYAHKFHGRRTASGQIYDKNGLTAAHRTLPFGTRVRVTNLRNDRSVVLEINDRGPWKKGRIVDVSHRAAQELGFVREGLTRVKVEVLSLASG